jgi:hypothetical protein
MAVVAGALLFILKLLLILMAALLVVLLVLLIMPVGYSISAAVKGSLILRMEASWAVIKVSVAAEDLSARVGMSVFGREIRLRRGEKKIRAKAEEKKRKGRRRKPGVAFFREALSFLKEVLEVLRPRELRAEGCYGLEDPADTAALSSLIMLAGSFLPGGQMELNPVFDSELIDIRLWIAGSVVPIMIVFIAVKYLLKKEVRRVLILREE